MMLPNGLETTFNIFFSQWFCIFFKTFFRVSLLWTILLWTILLWIMGEGLWLQLLVLVTDDTWHMIFFSFFLNFFCIFHSCSPFWYWFYNPHWSRDSVSPVCRIFPETAPLGWFSHRVAISVCLSVCVSAPSGAVFSRPPPKKKL